MDKAIFRGKSSSPWNKLTPMRKIFEKWFAENVQKCPSTRSLEDLQRRASVLRIDMSRMKHDLEELEEERMELLNYHSTRTSAWEAWKASKNG